MSRILIAGVGNIFLGDDAFGVEVAQRMMKRTLPTGVEVVDFGIRSVELNFALEDRYDAAILVDAAYQGGTPGTVYVLRPEMNYSISPTAEELMLELHDLDPNKVLRRVAARNGRCRHVILVGCEPQTFGDEMMGQMGLSEPVAAAVDETIVIIEALVNDMLAMVSGLTQLDAESV